MTTATASRPTPTTHTHEHVVSVAGAPVARGTLAACQDFAANHMRVSCTVMPAPEHAHVWPEAAVIPYAPDREWLEWVAAGTSMRTWADPTHVPGIRA